jgi:hypothetical protein
MIHKDSNANHLTKCYQECVAEPSCKYFGYNEDIPRCVLLGDLDRDYLAAQCSNEMSDMNSEQLASLQGTLVYMMNDEAFTLYDTEETEEVCKCKYGYIPDSYNSSQCVLIDDAVIDDAVVASVLTPITAPGPAPLLSAVVLAEQQIDLDDERTGAIKAALGVLFVSGALVIAAISMKRASLVLVERAAEVEFVDVKIPGIVNAGAVALPTISTDGGALLPLHQHV